MKRKILVIDDDTNVVDYLVTLFQDHGYEAVSASNAQDGLSVAQKEKPDLITLDLEMPGDWGPRFYRKLSQDPVLKNIPVVVISGLSGIEHAIQKAAASINKPFDKEDVLKVVNDILA